MIFLSANSRLLISDQHIRQIDSLFIQHLHSVISLIFGNISLSVLQDLMVQLNRAVLLQDV